jgi:hypothetical protein
VALRDLQAGVELANHELRLPKVLPSVALDDRHLKRQRLALKQKGHSDFSKRPFLI